MVKSMHAAPATHVLSSSVGTLWGDQQASPRGEAYMGSQQYPPIGRGREPATPWARLSSHRALSLASDGALRRRTATRWWEPDSISELRRGDG